MSKNSKGTSSRMASKASDILRDASASATQKSLAASALAQRGSAKQTGAAMEDKAARVLASPKYNDETKSLAATVLSQSNKER
jgi:hypothetical protein